MDAIIEKIRAIVERHDHDIENAMREIKSLVCSPALSELNHGDHFVHNGIEFVALDKVRDGAGLLAVTAKVWKRLPFDESKYNNFSKSSLQKELNTEFLDLIGKENLLPMVCDLTADNGDDSYGTVETYIGLLSCGDYRKYRKIMPKYNTWVWTCTPWRCGTPHSGYGNFVRFVYPDGSLSLYTAIDSNGVAPACVFEI